MSKNFPERKEIENYFGQKHTFVKSKVVTRMKKSNRVSNFNKNRT